MSCEVKIVFELFETGTLKKTDSNANDILSIEMQIVSTGMQLITVQWILASFASACQVIEQPLTIKMQFSVFSLEPVITSYSFPY